jgi:PDZ domain/Aspartyl protease
VTCISRPALCLAWISLLLVGTARPQAGTAPPPPTSADEIVRRWADAVGGEKLSTIRNVYTRGVYDGTYGHGVDEEWFTRLGQKKQLNVVQGGKRLHVFDGKRGWTRGRTGEVRPLSAREEAVQADTALIGSMAHLVPGENPRLRFDYRGVDASGCCYLMRMTSPNGPPSTWYIDRQTYLPVRQVGDPPLNFTAEFIGWKEFNGIKLPVKQVLTASTGYRSTSTLETAQFNLALPEGFFSRPMESARQFHFAKGNSALNIPIVEDNGHVFVQGSVNGTGPVWMTLDTGAGSAIIDKARIQDFGIKPTGTLPVEGVSGVETEETATDINFSLPGVSLLHQSSGVIPLDFISHRTGRPVAALLGYEFFENFVVEIDFARERMSLYDPRSFHYRGRGDIVALEFDANLPYIDASLKMPDGEVAAGKVVVDLGSEIPVMVQQDYATKRDLLKSLHPTTELRGRGVGGGEVVTVTARIAGIQIQHTFIARPIAAFPQNIPGSIAAKDAVGNLGGALLRHFRVIFDYSHQRMILERGGNFEEPFEADMSGLRIIASGPKLETVSIVGVIPESPADQAGLQVGDQVLVLDGKPVPEIRTLKNIFRQDGREVELTVKRGEVVEVRKLKLHRIL